MSIAIELLLSLLCMSIAIELLLSLLCTVPAIELLLSALYGARYRADLVCLVRHLLYSCSSLPCKWMVKTLIISQFCLIAADGMLIFVLNIIIIIIIIILAPASTLSAGY